MNKAASARLLHQGSCGRAEPSMMLVIVGIMSVTMSSEPINKLVTSWHRNCPTRFPLIRVSPGRNVGVFFV